MGRPQILIFAYKELRRVNHHCVSKSMMDKIMTPPDDGEGFALIRPDIEAHFVLMRTVGAVSWGSVDRMRVAVCRFRAT